MSTLTQPGLFKSSSCAGSFPASHGFVAMLRRVRDWQARRTAIRGMHRLSDHELRDIGIERGEIEAAASGGLSLLRRGR